MVGGVTMVIHMLIGSALACMSIVAPPLVMERLLAEGKAMLAQGDASSATDAFEAALLIDPGYVGAILAIPVVWFLFSNLMNAVPPTCK